MQAAVRLRRRALAVVAVAALSAAPQLLAQQPGVVQEPEVLPDLRIVTLEVLPAPLEDGATATLRLLLHNQSSAVAAGLIAVQVVHDNTTSQPLPAQQEVVYIGGDGRAVVSFEVPTVAMTGSPYTFYAMVDARDAVRESDETNNTAWARATVCGTTQTAEQADGFDNDCDGMVDEELGLQVGPAAAVGMLRALRQQARRDGVPLVFSLPRPFAPAPVEHAARLVSAGGDLVGPTIPPPSARRGPPPAETEIGAALQEADPVAQLTLIDWDGGALRSGDLISLRTAWGELIIAGAGGGRRVLTRTPHHVRAPFFTLVAVGGDVGGPVASGDSVNLVTSTGHFFSAEGGGGGRLTANRDSASGWESFTLVLDSKGDAR